MLERPWLPAIERSRDPLSPLRKSAGSGCLRKRVGASVAAVGAVEAATAVVEAAAAVVEVAAAVELVKVEPSSMAALVVVSASSSRVPVRPRRPSSFVSGTLGVGGLGLPCWGEMLRQNVAIFDLDFDAIHAAMYAVTDNAEGDCYLCVPPDPGIEAAALGASASAAPGAGESALSGTAPTTALHTFTLDSGDSRSFFRDSTTLTPLSRPVAVSLADPYGGPVLARSSTDAWVDQFTPGGQHVTHCTCSRMGRHLATFTHWPGSSLYTLTTASPPVTASGQVAASGQVLAAASRSSPVSAPCSCRPLSPETLLWHHCLGHPSLPRLRGMASRTLDAWVDQFTPGGQRVTHCTCSRMGRHLATFTHWPGSSLYTLTTASPPVTASGQVAASGQVLAAASRSSPVSAPCSCRPLSPETLLWHHCLGHPSLPRLRGMASRTLVSGLPRSLPPLPPGRDPTCVPCVEGRQCAAPHSSEFPPTEAPLQTLHMEVWGPARVSGHGHERYFLLVVDDYSRYTTVFPLRSKGEVTEVLIDWIRGTRRQLSESFGSDLPVLRLHSDRGGEFSFELLRAF
ncbi:unnamed protein product [Closterium sp. NIES-54]